MIHAVICLHRNPTLVLTVTPECIYTCVYLHLGVFTPTVHVHVINPALQDNCQQPLRGLDLKPHLNFNHKLKMKVIMPDGDQHELLDPHDSTKYIHKIFFK